MSSAHQFVKAARRIERLFELFDESVKQIQGHIYKIELNSLRFM